MPPLLDDRKDIKDGGVADVELNTTAVSSLPTISSSAESYNNGRFDGDKTAFQTNSKLDQSKSNSIKEIMLTAATSGGGGGVEKGRQSKVLMAEYKEELKSVNFSAETKNLLAQLASSSINADEDDDRRHDRDNDLSSEALTIKVSF